MIDLIANFQQLMIVIETHIETHINHMNRFIAQILQSQISTINNIRLCLSNLSLLEVWNILYLCCAIFDLGNCILTRSATLLVKLTLRIGDFIIIWVWLSSAIPTSITIVKSEIVWRMACSTLRCAMFEQENCILMCSVVLWVKYTFRIGEFKGYA